MKNINVIAIIIIASILGLFGYRAYQQQQNMIIQPPCLPGYVIGQDDTGENNRCIEA